MFRLASLLAICCALVLPVPAAAQEGAEAKLAPEAAMAFLVKTLPGLRKVDTWDGGWLEARLYGAGSRGPCMLTEKAHFALIHRADDTREASEPQRWELDFSTVTAIAQQGSRIVFKVAKVDELLGYETGSPELARRMAHAFDTLRRACVGVRPPKR